MNRRATRTPRARRDLAEIAAYIAIDSPTSAEAFLDAARDAVEKLVDHARMGADRSEISAKYPKLRSWPIRGFENYLIFYVPTSRGIRILRVLHGAMNLPSIFKAG